MQKAVEEVRRRKYLIDFCWNKAKYYIRSVDLMYIETINRKLKIVDGEGAERFSSGKIEEYEKKLYPYGFIRSHNSFLLNLNYVERTEGMQIYLRNKVILPISRKYLYGVRQAIAEKISGVMI